jgi:RNA polymerase sigma-70 factor (ECF subfamily)
MNQEVNVQEFVSLLTSHQGKINSYILTLVPNYSDSADIMQETARMMWSKFPGFEIGTDFLSWGLSIAHYRVLEFRRKKKHIKEIRLSEDVFDRLSTSVKGRQDNLSERISFLKKCFKLLNEHDQRIILLRYHENLKLREIAGRLGKNIQSIYRDISRIQESLLSCIKRRSLDAGSDHV